MTRSSSRSRLFVRQKTERGRRRSAATLSTQNEGACEHIFQSLQLLRNGRLGKSETCTGLAEAAAFHQSQERIQLVEEFRRLRDTTWRPGFC